MHQIPKALEVDSVMSEPATAPRVITEPPAVPAETQAPAVAAPATPAEPAEPAKKTLEDSLAALDDDTKAFVLGEVTKARKEAGDARGAAKAKAADEARAELAQTIGKALGLVTDNEPADPVKLTEQLTAKNAEAKQAQVELAVFRAAFDAGADPSALLDSRSFLSKVADLDPNDALAMAAAVGEAMTANPTFAKAGAPRVPRPNPALGASASGEPGIDAQIAEAKKKGDVKTWMHLENQKLSAPSR